MYYCCSSCCELTNLPEQFLPGICSQVVANLEPQLDLTPKMEHLHGWQLMLAVGRELGRTWTSPGGWDLRESMPRVSGSKRPIQKPQGVLWPGLRSPRASLLPHWIGQASWKGQPWLEGKRAGSTPWREVQFAGVGGERTEGSPILRLSTALVHVVKTLETD